jgi:hypothetical protein
MTKASNTGKLTTGEGGDNILFSCLSICCYTSPNLNSEMFMLGSFKVKIITVCSYLQVII